MQSKPPFARTALLVLALLMILSGCLPMPTSTPWPTRTPRPTRTPTPTTVPSPTITPTVTEVPISAVGTPLPLAGQQITVQNAARLELEARWGLGIPQGLAFSPDGSLLAVASTRGLFLFDGSTLEPLRSIESEVSLRSLAFSQDGAALASGAEDGKILLWNVADGALLRSFSAHSGPVFSLAFSTAFTMLASSGWDGAIRLWDPSTGEALRALSGNLAPARLMSFSADGERLFAWDPTDQLQIWTVLDGRARPPIYVGVDSKNHSGTSAAFSTAVDFFAVDQDTRVRIFYTESGNSLAQLNVRTPVERVALSSGGEQLATVDQTTLSIWNGQTGSLLRQFALPASGAAWMAFSPDGSRLATLGDALRLWRADAAGDGPQITGPAAFQPAYRLGSGISSDGAAVTNLLPDGSIHGYRLDDGSPLPVAGIPSGPVNAAAVSPGGEQFATAAGDASVTLWRASDGQVLYTWKGHRQMPASLAFSPGGDLLASGSSDATVRVWDTASGAEAATLQAPAGVARVVFSPDGDLLAAGTLDTVLLWQVPGWEALEPLSGSNPVFSPGGDLLAVSGSQAGRLETRLVEIGDRGPLYSLGASGSSLAFSPGGDLLAVSGRDISLWDTASGERLVTIESPAPHGKLSFSPDGALLVLSAWDGVVYVWGIP